MVSTVTIRAFCDDDSVEELTALLNRAYATLAELGLRYMATWQDAAITRRRMANGVCLLALEGELLVGAVTYYPPGALNHAPEYGADGVAVFGQLAVEPSQRGRGIGGKLIQRCEERALADGARALALDTAKPATHLITWYERLGFSVVGEADWPETNYESVIMSKPLIPSSSAQK